LKVGCCAIKCWTTGDLVCGGNPWGRNEDRKWREEGDEGGGTKERIESIPKVMTQEKTPRKLSLQGQAQTKRENNSTGKNEKERK